MRGIVTGDASGWLLRPTQLPHHVFDEGLYCWLPALPKG